MTKLNDFILALEECVKTENTVPSTDEMELAMRRAAIPVMQNGMVMFRFAGGEILSVKSCEKYAQMLVA